MVEAVVPIVDQGVDIDQENEAGATALHLAVINNDAKMVEFLLNRGADANRKTRVRDFEAAQATCECANRRYCLHVAHEFGNEMRDDGQNALHLAAKHSSGEVVKLLIERIGNVNEISDDGSTALHYATQNLLEEDADICVTGILLSVGADVNARNREGKTALYLAVKFEKLTLVTYLLSQGADVNISTTKQSTPLYSAIVNCNLQLVNLLLESKASIEVENEGNELPLFYTLRVVPRGESRLALVRSLLDNGASSDCRNNHGSTALHVAVQDKDDSLAQLMIARGCPIDAKDCFDMTALAVAVCTNLHNLAKLLLERGADANCPIKSSSVLEHAIIRRNEPMVGLLLRHEADINDNDRVLSAACMHKSTRIMQMLIDHGADINRKDARGGTALMRVIREPNYTMMHHLLEHGARINERDRQGNTALHVLFDNNSHAKENIIEYLLEQGADLNIENNDGHTPLRYMMFGCFTKGEVRIFIKHIAVLLARGLHVNPKISWQIGSDRTWTQYLSSCQTELQRMREARILDKCSYYDILTRKHSALGMLFHEENAVEQFELGMKTNAFFNYCDILRRCYNSKCKRLTLFKNGLQVMTNHVFRDIFPLEVVENLCEYLSNDDLTKLL